MIQSGVILFYMAEKTQAPKKTQLTLSEYLKVKEQRARNKLKLHYPLYIKILIAIPIVYICVTVVIFIVRVRFLSDH